MAIPTAWLAVLVSIAAFTILLLTFAGHDSTTVRSPMLTAGSATRRLRPGISPDRYRKETENIHPHGGADRTCACSL
jgi:hypothetical protein